MAKLRRALVVERMEKEVLKKATAYFARERRAGIDTYRHVLMKRELDSIRQVLVSNAADRLSCCRLAGFDPAVLVRWFSVRRDVPEIDRTRGIRIAKQKSHPKVAF